MINFCAGLGSLKISCLAEGVLATLLNSFIPLANSNAAMDSVITNPNPPSETVDVLPPVKVIEKLAQSSASGFLMATHNETTWYVYFVEGKIFYANHSLEPFERLELHLRRIGKKFALEIDQQIYLDLREYFSSNKLDGFYPSCDYQAICSLVSQKQLSQSHAINIIQAITKESLRTFLLLSNVTSKFIPRLSEAPILWSTNFLLKIKECQDENEAWKSLGPAITSSYQRPYLINGGTNLAPEVRDRLNKILVGFDFHQLSLVINQDSLEIAKSLHKLVGSGVVGLWEPREPLDRLPRTYTLSANEITTSFNDVPPAQDDSAPKTPAKVYKIVCVDDSPTVLREINRFLDSDVFQIFPIVDSATALMKIMRIAPDVILMDVGMPNIDGYKLCSMLRRNSAFKKTPIIMVTGNTGLIDRAKAKMSGCTDYLTKPFTQAGLIEAVFKHILD
jgi:two-component system, chemotaxis family, response regulator PixG